mmetsp:Transcript_71553/g.213511  ORF Transcript_71553/g.213511 Transcript_71553/m.213511 type:complete len:244 (-) Transcript_71553:277-1008(-)
MRSARTTPFNTFAQSELKSCGDGGTMPGQSSMYSRLVSEMYCHMRVSPGTGAALQTFFFFSVLMTEDFPTFGYPIMPMVTCFLSFMMVLNCRSRFSSEFFPKGFVIDAWKASVGYSFMRIWIHRRETHVGTRSTLFSTSTMCLCGRFFRISFSKGVHRVPMGSRASRTSTSTSAESTTFHSSPQIRLDVPLLKISSVRCLPSSPIAEAGLSRPVVASTEDRVSFSPLYPSAFSSTDLSKPSRS